MTDYLNEGKKLGNNIKEVTLSKQETFSQQFLLVSSTLLGIVVSLHSTNSQCLYIRLVFLLALVLLSLGVLANMIVVADFLQIRERAQKAFHDEWSSAVREDRQMGPLKVDWRKRTLFSRKAALICFVSGLIVLTSYSILIVFV